MSICHHTQRMFPFLEEFTEEDRRLAESAFHEQEGRRRKDIASRDQKADELVEDLRRQLHDLLGRKKLAELRQTMRRERLAFHELWQPPVHFGFLFRFAPQASDHFRVERQIYLDPSTGWVGNEAVMDCGDAGDFDYASATVEAQVAFGFEAPTTGLLEVLIDAQSTVGTRTFDISRANDVEVHSRSSFQWFIHSVEVRIAP
ncbi:MAG: hypothetical protein ACOWWM_20230 [Desulfobacterales bacterium]